MASCAATRRPRTSLGGTKAATSQPLADRDDATHSHSTTRTCTARMEIRKHGRQFQQVTTTPRAAKILLVFLEEITVHENGMQLTGRYIWIRHVLRGTCCHCLAGSYCLLLCVFMWLWCSESEKERNGKVEELCTGIPQDMKQAGAVRCGGAQ